MIVDIEASIEISKPVTAIFAEKMLVARAVAHAHEHGSSDELPTCLGCLDLRGDTGQGGKWTKHGRDAHLFHRVRVIFYCP